MQVKWFLPTGGVAGKLMWLILLLLLVYVLACAWLYFNQRSMMFFRASPMPTPEPASVLTLQHAGEVLKIWQIHPNQTDAILYFGGNAENVGESVPAFATHFPRHGVYLANYRGYAGSTGEPSETALFADALALYDQIRARHGKVLVVGRSLGSGVALYLATQRKIDSLVLVTPYDSVQQVASNRFPIFPVRLLLKDKFDSMQSAPQIQIPTLMLLAETDNVVPQHHSQRLFGALAATDKSSQTLVLTDHNSIIQDAAYWRRLQAFFALHSSQGNTHASQKL